MTRTWLYIFNGGKNKQNVGMWDMKFPQWWLWQLLKLKLIYDRQSVSQSVLVSGAHLGPATNFSFSLKFPSDSCKVIILWRPLWREGGSVICCTVMTTKNIDFWDVMLCCLSLFLQDRTGDRSCRFIPLSNYMSQYMASHKTVTFRT
jgi:hypothetical protein